MISLEINLRTSAKLLKLIETSPKLLERAIKIALWRIGSEMRNRAGRNAPFRSGNLRRSITLREMHRRVLVGTNLVYAPIHEYGGTITPRVAKWLTFKVNGKWVRTKRVVIPKYKGRGYFKPAFDSVSRKEKRIMNEELKAALR